ncbi:MAG: YicC/YloC family endoribonuclease [Gemmataceae bacterium]
MVEDQIRHQNLATIKEPNHLTTEPPNKTTQQFFAAANDPETSLLLSMTGYGEARGQTESLSFTIEVRSVNNRHLKLTLRAPEPYNMLESEFERVIRKFVRRGTVLIQLRIERMSRASDFRINDVALRSYVQQVHEAIADLDPHIRPSAGELLGQVLALPGVTIDSGSASAHVADEWPVLEQGLGEALARLQRMREEEGLHMVRELKAQREQIIGFLGEVRKLEPGVVQAYRDRLRERVATLLEGTKAELSDDDLIREVTVYAERSDIAEEVVRLDSHLQQFAEILDGKDESPGRKLEFVVQEMGRETNTMGSKAGDVAISRLVVEIKSVLEKIREMIQNIE